MRILCVHAHFDDYEFVASGTFDLWKQKLDRDLRARALVSPMAKPGITSGPGTNSSKSAGANNRNRPALAATNWNCCGCQTARCRAKPVCK